MTTDNTSRNTADRMDLPFVERSQSDNVRRQRLFFR